MCESKKRKTFLEKRKSKGLSHFSDSPFFIDSYRITLFLSTTFYSTVTLTLIGLTLTNPQVSVTETLIVSSVVVAIFCGNT